MPKYPWALESLPVGVEEEIDWSASEVCSMMVVVVVGNVDGDDDEEDCPFCGVVFVIAAVVESSTSFRDWIESVRDGGFGRRNNLISILREDEEAGKDDAPSSSDGIPNIIIVESSPSSSSSFTSSTTFQGFKYRGADSNGIHPPELSRDS